MYHQARSVSTANSVPTKLPKMSHSPLDPWEVIVSGPYTPRTQLVQVQPPGPAQHFHFIWTKPAFGKPPSAFRLAEQERD